MWGAQHFTAESTPLTIEPDFGSVPNESLKAALGTSESPDVLNEENMGPELSEQVPRNWPEVSLIFCSELLPSGAIGLAGDSAHDEIHSANEVFDREGFEIVPNRSCIQGLAFHPRHESGRCVGFPLDVTDSSTSGSETVVASDADSKVKSADS